MLKKRLDFKISKQQIFKAVTHCVEVLIRHPLTIKMDCLEVGMDISAVNSFIEAQA